MIVLENVGRSYGDVAAVRDVSLTVEPGECLVLVGGSGSGKSTTLRMINRLVEPDTGRVLFEGEDVRKSDAPALRRRIGYVIQQAGLFPHWDVARNVATVPALLGWDRARVDARVDELLDLLGLPPATFRHRPVRELSGGQAQRVGIARALAADPPVLLMDEPFSALDPATRRLLQGELVRLRAATGKTIVFVTHDIDEAVTLGTRIAVMRDAALVQLATPAELLARPADAGVRDLLGGERAGERLLDAVRVAERCQPGEAPAAAPAIAPDATLREALARMIASGSDMLRVEGAAPRRLAIGDLLVRSVRGLAAAFGVLAALLLVLPHAGPLLGAMFPDTRPPLYPYASLAVLAARQAALVVVAVVAASLVGVGLGIATTRGPGRRFRPLAASLATVGQVFPPVAVLALAVPALGYGRLPALLALFLYAILPVLANTLAGLDGVDGAIREAAMGMGFSPGGRLAKVELPLAFPTILAGIRTAAIVDLGTASIASTVGVPTLGAPILDGLVGEKTGFVFQGALVAVALALAFDAAFGAVLKRSA